MPDRRCLQRGEGPPDRCLVVPRTGAAGKSAAVFWNASQAHRAYSPFLSVAWLSPGWAPAGLRGDIVAPNAHYLRHDSMRYWADVRGRFRHGGADVRTPSSGPIRHRTWGVETNRQPRCEHPQECLWPAASGKQSYQTLKPGEEWVNSVRTSISSDGND